MMEERREDKGKAERTVIHQEFEERGSAERATGDHRSSGKVCACLCVEDVKEREERTKTRRETNVIKYIYITERREIVEISRKDRRENKERGENQ
jgi:hypothetical protein